MTALPALTGLRFVAAALVVVHHAPGFGIGVPKLPLGGFAVSVFFVLSGFILAHVYPKLEDRQAVSRFITLRLARLWPLHLVTLILASIVLGAAIAPQLIANLTLTHAWIPAQSWYFSYNALSWTISVEFFFYLAFPLLIYQWDRTFWWKWAAAGALVVALVAISDWLALPHFTPGYDGLTRHGLLYINPLARLFEFVTGMVAYRAFVWLKPRFEVWRSAYPRLTVLGATAAELLLLGAVIVCLVYNPLGKIAEGEHWTYWSLRAGGLPAVAPLLILLAFGVGAVSRALSIPAIVFLGEISYGLYLTHQLIFVGYWNRWPVVETDVAGLILCTALALLLSAGLWRFVEMPSRNYVKGRLRQKVSSAQSQAA